MNKYIDIAERVAWSGIQGFAAAWIVLGDFSATTLKIAAIAAAASAAKCILAVNIGDSNSAAAIPLVTGNDKPRDPDTIGAPYSNHPSEQPRSIPPRKATPAKKAAKRR